MRLCLNLQCTSMQRKAWLNTSSRKLVWMPFSSMQVCERTGRCTRGCSKQALRWMHRIEISSLLIRVISYIAHTQEATVSSRLWIPWKLVNHEMSILHSTAVRMQAIAHQGSSIKISRWIMAQSSVIKGMATEIRGEMTSSMMSERMTLSRDHNQFMITRDKIQLVEAIDSNNRSDHQNNQCLIELSNTSSHNWCRNQRKSPPQKMLKYPNKALHHDMIHIVRVKKYFRNKPPLAKEVAIQANLPTEMVKMESANKINHSIQLLIRLQVNQENSAVRHVREAHHLRRSMLRISAKRATRRTRRFKKMRISTKVALVIIRECQWIILKQRCNHNLAAQVMEADPTKCLLHIQLPNNSLICLIITPTCSCSRAMEVHGPACNPPHSNSIPRGMATIHLALGTILVDNITLSLCMARIQIRIHQNRNIAVQETRIVSMISRLRVLTLDGQLLQNCSKLHPVTTVAVEMLEPQRLSINQVQWMLEMCQVTVKQNELYGT